MKRVMKLTAMLMCVATMGMFVACGDDNEDLIVGKWDLTAYSKNGGEAKPVASGSLIWEFKTNGIWTEKTNDELETDVYTATYTVSGDKLTLYDEDLSHSVVTTIDKLDKKELAVSVPYALGKGESDKGPEVYYFKRM